MQLTLLNQLTFLMLETFKNIASLMYVNCISAALEKERDHMLDGVKQSAESKRHFGI